MMTELNSEYPLNAVIDAFNEYSQKCSELTERYNNNRNSFLTAFGYIVSSILDNREALILEKRYKDGLTFRKIAEDLGISSGRVHQINGKTSRKIRNQEKILLLGLDAYINEKKTVAYRKGIAYGIAHYDEFMKNKKIPVEIYDFTKRFYSDTFVPTERLINRLKVLTLLQMTECDPQDLYGIFYTKKDFIEAVKILNDYGCDITALKEMIEEDKVLKRMFARCTKRRNEDE